VLGREGAEGGWAGGEDVGGVVFDGLWGRVAGCCCERYVTYASRTYTDQKPMQKKRGVCDWTDAMQRETTS